MSFAAPRLGSMRSPTRCALGMTGSACFLRLTGSSFPARLLGMAGTSRSFGFAFGSISERIGRVGAEVEASSFPGPHRAVGNLIDNRGLGLLIALRLLFLELLNQLFLDRGWDWTVL